MSSIILKTHAEMCSTVADYSPQRLTPIIGNSYNHKILQLTKCSWLLLKDFFFNRKKIRPLDPWLIWALA